MNKLFERKMDCYGCRACEDICPKNAIQMEADEQGFSYPAVDQELCVSCGLCTKACQIGKTSEVRTNAAVRCLGVKNHDTIRLISSSGGIYTAISEYVLSAGGLCVGAAYDEEMQVTHAFAATREERDRFRGSKYVQSNMGGIYRQIQKYLSAERSVLFTGTPCQCAALKLYLKTTKTDTNNLFVMDLVCHGAPSPGIWKEYVRVLEKEMGAKMVDYTFRNKEVGWRNYNIKAWFENGKTCTGGAKGRVFAKLFSADVMLRPSCYYCPYASLTRCTDVTIGDFWGIEQIDGAFSDNKGISMLLINTRKGAALWEACQANVESCKEYSVTQLTQPQLFGPTDHGYDYDKFWKAYTRKGYSCAAAKFGDGNQATAKYYTFMRKVRNKLRRL